MCSWESVSKAYESLGSSNTYMGDIPGYCDFRISSDILSRLSRREFLSSIYLACASIAGLTDHSRITSADLIT